VNLLKGPREHLHLLLEHGNFSRRLELAYIFGHLERIRLARGTAGLDIACGLGTQTIAIADRLGVPMIGLDMDPAIIRMARLQRRPGALDFFVGDSRAMPFAAASFDVATSVCAFEHFPDDRRAFAEAARVVRPGGWFVLTVDSLSHPSVTESFRSRHRVACHVSQYYTADDLRSRLDQAGFDVIDIRYLVRGRIASLVTRIGLATDYGKTYLALSTLLYPLIMIEERLARGEYGYKLGAAARRRGAATTRS